MDPKTLEQNKEIGALMQEFVGRTVDFYNDLPSQPVCRPASQEALERLQRQPIPAAGDRRAVPPAGRALRAGRLPVCRVPAGLPGGAGGVLYCHAGA